MTQASGFPSVRLRRLRSNPRLRDLVRETELNPRDFILPLFVRHGQDQRLPIKSMPGHDQMTVDHLPREIDEIASLGIPAVILFGIPEHKDAVGSDAYDPNGVIQQAVRAIKATRSDVLVMTDVCFCEFTDHGHCGIVNDKHGHTDVDNDATLGILVNYGQQSRHGIVERWLFLQKFGRVTDRRQRISDFVRNIGG